MNEGLTQHDLKLFNDLLIKANKQQLKQLEDSIILKRALQGMIQQAREMSRDGTIKEN